MSNPIVQSWTNLPIVGKVLIILGSAFTAGGTTVVATGDHIGLPDRVEVLEESDVEQSTMLRFLVCAERTDSSEGCEFILNEEGNDAALRTQE
jgi:hypothetical protein